MLFNITVVEAASTATRDSRVELVGPLLDEPVSGTAIAREGWGPFRPRGFVVGTCSHLASKCKGGLGFVPGEIEPSVAS